MRRLTFLKLRQVILASSESPSSRILLREAFTSRFRVSTPTALARKSLAAAITILASPEPRSNTASPGFTEARESIVGIMSSGVGTWGSV